MLTGVCRPSGEAITTPRRSYPKPQTPAAPYETSKVMLLHAPPKTQSSYFFLHCLSRYSTLENQNL